MKKLFLAAAVMAMAFTSCNDDVNNNGNNPVGGEGDAYMSLSFTMPASARTRLDDGDNLTANDHESNVKTVSVFIFEESGLLASVGGFTEIPVASFTNTAGVYTLQADKQIETTTGPKRIYVGVNLPFSTFTGSEANLLAASATAASMSVVAGTATDSAFTMFSEVEPLTLVADTDTADATNVDNKVSVDVKRVVAKVVVSADNSVDTGAAAGTFTKTWNNGSGLTLKYTAVHFRVYQHNLTSYVASNLWAGTGWKSYPGTTTTALNGETGHNFNPFATDNGVTPAAITLDDPADADIIKMAGFYIGENYPVENSLLFSKNGNTTYIMAGTTVVADKAAVWDTATASVKWEAVTPYGGGTTDIYVVQFGGQQVLTDTKAKADAIVLGQGGVLTDPNNDGIYFYPMGWVHFPVYLLNRDGSDVVTNDYAINRNEFVHVKISGITTGDFFPGYPGEDPADGGDPGKPTDPTKDLPETPTPPIDPEEPVDGSPAWLQVEVTPLPWTYKTTTTVLE
jgi:hypothetical protein